LCFFSPDLSIFAFFFITERVHADAAERESTELCYMLKSKPDLKMRIRNSFVFLMKRVPQETAKADYAAGGGDAVLSIISICSSISRRRSLQRTSRAATSAR